MSANERRPAGAASESFSGDIPSMPPAPDSDLVRLPRRVWQVYLDGYTAGYAAGVDRGRAAADADAAALHAGAWRIVQAAARLEPHDVARQARRDRMVAAYGRRTAAATPWPAETAPPTRGALFVVPAPVDVAHRRAS